jgi:hypothetical protein
LGKVLPLFPVGIDYFLHGVGYMPGQKAGVG